MFFTRTRPRVGADPWSGTEKILVSNVSAKEPTSRAKLEGYGQLPRAATLQGVVQGLGSPC